MAKSATAYMQEVAVCEKDDKSETSVCDYIKV